MVRSIYINWSCICSWFYEWSSVWSHDSMNSSFWWNMTDHEINTGKLWNITRLPFHFVTSGWNNLPQTSFHQTELFEITLLWFWSFDAIFSGSICASFFSNVYVWDRNSHTVVLPHWKETKIVAYKVHKVVWAEHFPMLLSFVTP